jgi:hypothetical protein
MKINFDGYEMNVIYLYNQIKLYVVNMDDMILFYGILNGKI